MPTFRLDKLVRDNFPAIYQALGEKAVVKKLTTPELSQALVEKIIEEASEITDKSSKSELTEEIADLQQILDDLKSIHNISDGDVAKIQAKKKTQKGGFSQGVYIETITLKADDVWVEYYRKDPVKFPEIGQ